MSWYDCQQLVLPETFFIRVSSATQKLLKQTQ